MVCKTTKKSESSDRGRRGCGHSPLPLASARFRGRVPNPGPTACCRMRPMGGVRSRSFPHESGLRALSVLLMAACCILGALRDGSHEPAVDCKARHGRFREKERLFVLTRNDARTPDDSCPAVRLSGGCSERSLLWNSASGDTVRFFRTVRRKTALACERRMLGLPPAFVRRLSGPVIARR